MDSALLKRLTGSHSKSPSEFQHLETGTWKIRHHLTYQRLLYHHHILTRGDEETIKKIYFKQKEDSVRGDWYKLLEADFKFLEIELNEDEICHTPKNIYKVKIKDLISKAAFKHFLTIKETHSKLNDLSYSELKVQPYLTSNMITNEQKQLLYKLRSKCHESKMNFRKMHKNNLKCVFGCSQDEDQKHAFLYCWPIVSKIKNHHVTQYNNLFGTLQEQEKTIQIFSQIQKMRKDTLLLNCTDKTLPEGLTFI